MLVDNEQSEEEALVELIAKEEDETPHNKLMKWLHEIVQNKKLPYTK